MKFREIPMAFHEIPMRIPIVIYMGNTYDFHEISIEFQWNLNHHIPENIDVADFVRLVLCQIDQIII